MSFLSVIPNFYIFPYIIQFSLLFFLIIDLMHKLYFSKMMVPFSLKRFPIPLRRSDIDQRLMDREIISNIYIEIVSLFIIKPVRVIYA